MIEPPIQKTFYKKGTIRTVMPHVHGGVKIYNSRIFYGLTPV